MEERSRQVADVLGFLKHGWDSTMANVVPVVRQVFESQFDPRAGDYSEFRWAQQAMAFLVLDLTETQLERSRGNLFAAGASKDLVSEEPGPNDETAHLTRDSSRDLPR